MVPKEGGRPSFLDRTIITYSISHLSQSEKVRFYYALKGRNGTSGIIHQFGLRQLAKTVLMTDHHNEGPLLAFLSEWGCPIERLPVLVRGGPTNHRKPRAMTISPSPSNTGEVQQAP